MKSRALLRSFVTLIGTLFFLVLAQHQARAANLIAHYQFDVCDLDVTSIVADSVGNYDGAINGAVSRNTQATSGIKPQTCSSGEFNGGTVEITGLPVSTSNGAKTSVSFWMYWDGTENVMPVGWRIHDLWFISGSFGFNSGNGDIYGISSAGLANGWHHVVAVFTNNNLTNNRLLIDGVEQTLTQRRNSPNNSRAVVGSDFRISGWAWNNSYRFSGRIDEVKIYNGEMNATEISNDLNYSNNACPGCPPPPPPAPATLIAQYNFDDDWESSNALTDSVNANNGALIGNVSRVLSPASGVKKDTCYAGQFSGGAFDINGLPVSTASGDVTTVSFWMNWDGTNSVMPMGFQLHDLWFYGGSFGFNSFAGDLYGISSSGLANGWHHVVAVFHNNQLTNNKLYIDGVEQALTQRRGSPNNSRAVVNSRMRLSGVWGNNGYRFRGQLDEFKVYTGELSAAEVLDDLNAGCSSASSLVAEYWFDETVWNGTANEVTDNVGSFDSDAVGLTTTPNAQVCRAGDFSANGTSDYVSLDNGSLNGAGDFTISVWGKTSNTGQKALVSGSSGSQHNELIMWFPNSTTFSPYLKGSAGASINIPSIADDNWHHFLWTRSGSENCLYMDGSLQGCRTMTTNALTIASGGLIVGQEQDSLGGGFSSGQDWEGEIDELLIFDKALSASEASDIYNNQLAGNNWDGTPRACTTLLLELRMDDFLWNGSAGDVTDNSSNGYDSTSFNGLTNDNTRPAVSGNPGTCHYGQFDGDNDYIALPSSFPDLTESFTITAWINARDLNSGSRILIDDASNSQGFGFSLGDPGAGKLRFFSRNVSPISVDTQNAVISTNTWHFVAAVHDSVNKTRQIYVDGVAVNLNSGGTSSTYTGSWGSDAAVASVGGEINSSSESGPAFHFNGSIDEVRVYNGALDSTLINEAMNQTHPCTGVPTGEWRFDESSWANGVANEVIDSGANSYHGAAVNASPSTGLLCNAADLSASGTADYLLQNNTILNGATDFTISMWIKTSKTGAQSFLSGSSGSQHNELIMWFPSSTIFRPYLKGGNASLSITNIADNNWHHMVWTRSGSSNCLYMDGALQGCVSLTTSSLSIANGGLIVGQEQDSLGGSFDPSQGVEGLVDEFIVFPSALSAAEISAIRSNHLAGNGWDGSPRSCPGPLLDHYQVSFAGSTAVTCEPTPVTVTAVDSGGGSITIPSGTQLTLSTDIANDSWTNPGGSGAVYTVPSDAASIQYQLRKLTPGAIEIDVTDGNGITDDDGNRDDDIITFSNAGFIFYADGVAGNIGTQISGKASDVSPNAQTITLKAVQSNPTDPGVCDALVTNSSADIGFAYRCDNPNSCATTNNGAAINSALNSTPIDADSVVPYTNVNLNFDGNGIATFNFDYSDAGNIALLASADLPVSNTNPAGGTANVQGGSNSFLVKPAGLCVEATEANSLCSGPDYGSCTAFRKVDVDFNLRISGRAWGGSGENDIDYCDNAVPKNFQLSNINLSSTLVAPSSGSNTILSASSTNISDVSGLVDQALSVDEVGVFRITATPASNYFSETIAASTSANIGRFIPHHYTIVNGSIIPAAVTFSYLGQPFTAQYDVRAVDSSGAVVGNYRNGGSNHNFIKLNIDSGVSYGAVNDPSGSLTYLTSRISSSSASFSWGNGEALLVNVPLTVGRIASVDGPFDNVSIGALATDGDGVTLEPVALDLDTESPSGHDRKQLGSTVFRYGRVFIPPIYGPEVPLNALTSIPFDIEYWDGTTFVTNTDDSSSVYDAWALPTLGGCTDGSVLCADVTVSFPSAPAAVINGKSDPLMPITISRPGVGKTGDLTIQVDVDPWLEFDWLGTGDVDPSTQINFGSYRGHDRIIYWRER